MIFLIVNYVTLNVNAVEFPYVLGTNNFDRPDMAKPVQGDTYTDPNFHTSISRVTDAQVNGNAREVHIYATVNVFTSDGKYLFLGPGVRVYDAESLEFIKSVPISTEGRGDPEIRPHPSNPELFYYRAGTKFRLHNIWTGEDTVIRDFKNDYPDAQNIHTETQGDPSADMRYWAFEIWHWNGNVIVDDIVIYDMENDSIVSRYSDHWNPINVRWVSMSHSGEHIIVKHWGNNFCASRYSCINGKVRTRAVAFRRDFSNPVGIAGADGHSDKATAADGSDVIVYGSFRTRSITMAYLDTGETVVLSGFPGGGYHISGNNFETPGWALVSTYGDRDGWSQKQLYMVELKSNPKVWRLAHTHSVVGQRQNRYWSTPKASISQDGSKIVFSSNWNDASAVIDTYLIDLPGPWYQDLSQSGIE